MTLENRVHKRYWVNEDVYLTFNDTYSSGKVIDISHGGLSFAYLCSFNEKKHGLSLKAGVDIWTPKNDIHISNIPCEIIYDLLLDDAIVKKYEYRRCGVKFLYTDDFITTEIDRMYDLNF